MPDDERQARPESRLVARLYGVFDIPFLLHRQGNPRHTLAGQIPNRPLRVLDVCTGPANSAIAIARANDRNRIVGVDLSPAMLAAAQRKIRRRGLRNVSLGRMDAAALAFPDGAFDVAVISFGLHELDPRVMTAVLREMGRVLGEGGQLYIVDYDREEGFLGLVLATFLDAFEPAHVPQFLDHDWGALLGGLGLRVTEKSKYLFSKRISAVKRCTAQTWQRR
jgi:ubiquinone/menaquinone biosynthesis C-methylase UbiE